MLSLVTHFCCYPHPTTTTSCHKPTLHSARCLHFRACGYCITNTREFPQQHSTAQICTSTMRLARLPRNPSHMSRPVSATASQQQMVNALVNDRQIPEQGDYRIQSDDGGTSERQPGIPLGSVDSLARLLQAACDSLQQQPDEMDQLAEMATPLVLGMLFPVCPAVGWQRWQHHLCLVCYSLSVFCSGLTFACKAHHHDRPVQHTACLDRSHCYAQSFANEHRCSSSCSYLAQ